MGAHALGAAGYAAKASALDGPADRGDEIGSQTVRQMAAMSDAVADALARLPALGENGAGPLGPGRLSSGHVGRTVRAIQAELRRRPTAAGSP